MFSKIILVFYIILKIVPSLVSLPFGEEEELKPLLHNPHYSQMSQDFDCLIIEDGEGYTMARQGSKKRILTQNTGNGKPKKFKTEVKPQLPSGSDKTWLMYCQAAHSVFFQDERSRGPRLSQFVHEVLTLGPKFDMNAKRSEAIAIQRRKVINLATELLDGEEMPAATRLWVIGILSYLAPKDEVENHTLDRTDIDILIPSRAELEADIFHGPRLASVIQNVFVYGGSDTIAANAMWEGLERSSTLLSIKNYIKTNTNPTLDRLAQHIEYFITLGTPLGNKEVSTMLQNLFRYVETLMSGNGTLMQKLISLQLLLHLERHNGFSRVEIRTFVQGNGAYTDAFRKLCIDLLDTKVPQLDQVFWDLKAKKNVNLKHVEAILKTLRSLNLSLADKGNLFRVLNLTCVMRPDVRELVNTYLDNNPESTTFIFEMLRKFYNNLEPKNENTKDLKDDIEEKGLQLVMPQIRRPVEEELISRGFQGYILGNLPISARMDVKLKETLSNAISHMFRTLKLLQKDSDELSTSNPGVLYILHLITIKNNDKNLSLCLYSKAQPVFDKLLLTVCESITMHEYIKFDEFLQDLELKISLLLTSLTLGFL